MDFFSSVTFVAIVSSGFVALELVLRIVALGVIPGNRRPTSGMAWLLLILAAPLLGFLAFLLLGRTRLGRERHQRQERAIAAVRAATARLQPVELDADAPAYVASVLALNRGLGSLPATAGNEVEIEPDYEASIARMAAAVRDAQDYVHVEFYITAWDEVTDPLLSACADAAARGVEVRLLFDHLGTRGLGGYRALCRRLDATEIAWHPMLPLKIFARRFRRPDLRNHRKLVVVDGRVGFMGSQNLTEPGYHDAKNHEIGRRWTDLMIQVHGPIVAALEVVFAGDWYAETGVAIPVEPHEADTRVGRSAEPVHQVTAQLVPSGPGYPAENNLRLFTTLIYAATRRISLTSPYFVPDESLLYAVTTAAQRGVEVELFVGEEADQFMVGHAQSSYYRALLEAGVTIRLYPAPAVLHSKHFTIDDDVAVIGSSNMDMRSFQLNYEISLMLLGAEVVGRLRAVEDTYREVSRELSLEEWLQRPRRLKYVDNVMRLTSALQ